MSGGSYDYLGTVYDLDGLLQKRHQLDAMRDRLAGLGYAKDAAMETEELIRTLRQFEVRLEVALKRLQPVWHAIEWWDSCDWGEDAVKRTLDEYRGVPLILEGE
jgi:hypothetical protein